MDAATLSGIWFARALSLLFHGCPFSWADTNLMTSMFETGFGAMEYSCKCIS